jgi:hypothetical protein
MSSASADGTARADAGYTNGTVRLWQVSAGNRPEFAARLTPGGRVTPSFTPDGQIVAIGLPTTLWKLADPTQPRPVGRAPTYNQGGQATAFGPDGRTLVSGDPISSGTPATLHISARSPRT